MVSEFYKNAKMVSKSSKHGKTHKQFKWFFFSVIVITCLRIPFIEMWKLPKKCN